jgi:endoglucanase
MMTLRERVARIATLAVIGTLLLGAAASRASAANVCFAPNSALRDPSNPLDLPVAPGANPLSGARFFVEGPGNGLAAGAIAQLLGRDPASFGNTRFSRMLEKLGLGALVRLLQDVGLARKVTLLRKIAVQPETKRFSIYTAGGGRGAMYSNTMKFLCRMQAMEPGASPFLETYFLKHTGSCSTNRETPRDQSRFRRRVRELARAIGNFPVVIYAELDAVDTARCLSPAGLRDRIKLLKYEIDKLSRLPHAVVYVEGGVSDANSAGFAARILNQAGIRKIRGFFLNDTHYQWTINEVRFGNKISRLTHGAHFIVGTQDNGNGPLLNPHPARQGTENLCNPPGRGTGPQPTTNTGFPFVDGFEWISTPGRSSGSQCHPGDPPSGTFGTDLALALAANANNQLGPGYPSSPY